MFENKKYEMLSDDTIEVDGHTLHRIRAVKDNPQLCLKGGDIGGYIEKEDNLSQYGYCWVDRDAKVFENAYISGHAVVGDNAEIRGNAKISGYALVSNNVHICDKARVYGFARIYDNVMISGDAEVCAETIIRGDIVIKSGYHAEYGQR